MAVEILQGDCLEVVATMAADSVHSIVTDPPYGLSFMGKEWDHGVPGVPYWQEFLRVAKPGAHLLAFGGTRTFHRLTVAIEDAGWEIRDCIMWVYSQGFPKSLNVGCKCHDKATEQKAEHSLRSVQPSDVSPPKSLEKEQGEILFPFVPQQGLSTSRRKKSSASKVRAAEQCVEGRSDIPQETRELRAGEVCSVSSGLAGDGTVRWLCDGASSGSGESLGSSAIAGGMRSPSQPSTSGQSTRESSPIREQQGPQALRGARNATADVGRCSDCGGVVGWDGWGTALKPAWEPIIVARKPLCGTVADNVQAHGTGGINIGVSRIGDEERVAAFTSFAPCSGNRLGEAGTQEARRGTQGEPKTYTGRWPANVIHDGSPEVLEQFPNVESGQPAGIKAGGKLNCYSEFAGGIPVTGYGDAGSAARFFYCAKASGSDRESWNNHPTVKPTELMAYLVNLVTPDGGTVLDPFLGSGTTAVVAKRNGFDCIGIELNPDYVAIAKRRTQQGSLL